MMIFDITRNLSLYFLFVFFHISSFSIFDDYFGHVLPKHCCCFFVQTLVIFHFLVSIELHVVIPFFLPIYPLWCTVHSDESDDVFFTLRFQQDQSFGKTKFSFFQKIFLWNQPNSYFFFYSLSILGINLFCFTP